VHGEADSAICRIEEFIGYLVELRLQVTETAAADLKAILTRLKALSADAVLDTGMCNEISHAVNRLDATLDAELKLRTAFIVTPKRFKLSTCWCHQRNYSRQTSSKNFRYCLSLILKKLVAASPLLCPLLPLSTVCAELKACLENFIVRS
jgi:hypothetical protein